MQEPVRQSDQKPTSKSPLRPWLQTGLVLLTLFGLWELSQHNYLLYHSSVETLSIVVAATIFSIGWNSRQFVQDDILLLLAVAYLVVGTFDLQHVLSFKGMGVFPDRDANLATQLWIAARYMESIALLWTAALIGKNRHLNPYWLLTCWLLAGSLLLTTILIYPLFPACYVDGIGLTPFKVWSEYVISVLLALAALLFWRRRRHMHPKLLGLLIASSLLTIASELSFTLYVDVYGVFNFLGHAFKLTSVVMVYLALVQFSFKSPYRSIFHQLSRELSQRKASEEKLRVANQELDAFVHTVSHDLRTPLTPIIGYADFLAERCTHNDSETQEVLGRISAIGRQMLETMEDLLIFAKMGKLKLAEQAIPVEKVVDRILETYSIQQNAAVQTVRKQDLPHTRIPESLLWQIFNNLIGNALTYGQGADILIGGERRNTQLRLFVQDHGPGISTDEREQIFDLFYRGAGQSRSKGSGIGLAIVQKIAKIYHGRAWAEETLGGGVTFWVEMYEGQAD